MNYTVSFVIPTLNEEKFLPFLLQDIKKQVYKNFEVLVVDGDSEDKTREIADEYSEYFPTTIINAKKRNLSFQRNLGAGKANSSYIVFIDADSRIPPNFTRLLKKEIEKTQYLIYLPTVVPLEGNVADEFSFKLINFITEVSQPVGKPMPSISCMVFEKNFFLTLGGYNENGHKGKSGFYPEDHEIILRARKRGVIGKFMEDVRVGFSLRRLEKDGRFNVLSKHLRSSYHMFMKGDIDESLFDYEMGGHMYDDDKERERKRKAELNTLLEQFKKTFKEIVST